MQQCAGDGKPTMSCLSSQYQGRSTCLDAYGNESQTAEGLKKHVRGANDPRRRVGLQWSLHIDLR